MTSVRLVTSGYVVHLVAFEHGLGERERNRRFLGGVYAGHEVHSDVARPGARHPRQKLVTAAVEDRDRVADAEPQHARQVFGFVF